MAGAGARGGWLYFIICIFAAARRMKRGFRGESKGEGDGRRVEEEEEEEEDENGGIAKRELEARRKEVVVRPCGSMKSKATLSPELPPFGNDVFRLPGARGINPICLPPSSRV